VSERAAQAPNPGKSLSDQAAYVFSGILTGGVSVVASVSLAALIFSGELKGHLAYGVDLALMTAAIVGLVVSLGGSCAVAIAIPQDRTAPILAIMAAAIAAAAPAQAESEQVLLNVAVAIAATTLVTGAFLLALGLFRAGGLMRFMPYSVLSGFFAGTGWLLLLGGMRVMTGHGLDSPTEIAALFDNESLVHWLPGAGLAVAIMVASRLLSHAFALPVSLLAATGTFFLVALLNGETIDTLVRSGWLLGLIETTDASGPRILHLGRLIEGANWTILLDHWPGMGTVLVISAMSILLTVSALELLSAQDVDIDRELKVAGVGNLAAGLAGGMVGFHSLSISSLALKLGGKSRVPGVVAALTCALALFVGTEIIALLPRFVVGGLLFYLGLSFLVEWMFGSFRRLPLGEYLLIPLIVVIIATVGFVEGVVAGLLAALLMFVLDYSRIDVIRHALTGTQIRSSVERNLDDARNLARHGEQIEVLKLNGHLFFGTATQILTWVRERVDERGKDPLAYVLLDFARVSGIDSSANYALHRLCQLANRRGFDLVLTGLRPDLRGQVRLKRTVEGYGHVQFFPDLDHGLEWCENRLLESLRGGRTRAARTILQHLSALFPNDPTAARFLGYLLEVPFEKGQELIRQGDASTDLFFVEIGEVSVFLLQANGTRVRLRRTGAGTILGELGFYLNLPRTASVVADKSGKAYRLTAASLAKMDSEQPELSAALHRFMAHLLAERLVSTTRTLETLMD